MYGHDVEIRELRENQRRLLEMIASLTASAKKQSETIRKLADAVRSNQQAIGILGGVVIPRPEEGEG